MSQPDQGLPIGDLTDLLRRRPDVLRAQEAVAEAETASYTSLVALYKALGGGWQAPAAAKGVPTT